MKLLALARVAAAMGLFTGLGVAAVPPAAAAVPAVSVTATIPVGTGPAAVAVDPLTDTVYVGNSASGTVSVISGLTNKVTATIPNLGIPVALAINPLTDTVYVINYASNAVLVISGLTNKVIATIPVGQFPNAVAVRPTTDTVYVTDDAGAEPGSVSVISGLTNKVIATDEDPYGLPTAVAPDLLTPYVYVTDPVNPTLDVTSAGPVMAIANVGGSPQALAAGSGVAFLASAFNLGTNTPSGKVYILSPGRPGYQWFPTPAGAYPDALALNTTTSSLYVVDTPSRSSHAPGQVLVFSEQTSTVTATVPVGLQPQGVGVDPLTNRTYVTNYGSNTVSVISG